MSIRKRFVIHTLFWMASWGGLAQNIVKILTLELVKPRWEYLLIVQTCRLRGRWLDEN